MFRKIHGMLLAAFAVAACTMSISCQTNKFMHLAARAAGDEVGALEWEIRQKIRAENEYYQRTIELTVDDIRRGREDSLNALLIRESEKFAQRHASPSADRLAGELVSHMNDFIRNWESAEDRRQNTIRSSIDKLERSRRELEFDGAKLRQLRNGLLALSEQPTMRNHLCFIVSYAVEVKSALDVLREEAKSAEESAASAHDRPREE